MNSLRSLIPCTISISRPVCRWRSRCSIVLLALCCSFSALADLSDDNLPTFEQAANLYRSNDYAAAHRAFLKIANRGNPRAQTIIGMMHRFGEGVPVDLEAAYDAYLSAAQQGHGPAQYQVSLMLETGSGVPKNPEASKYWLAKAAGQGYEKAIDRSFLALQETKPPIKRPTTDRVWNFELPKDFKAQLQPASGGLQIPVIRTQLGAMRSKDAAIDLWRLIQDELPELTRALPFTISHHFELGKTPVYRLRVGDFESITAAERFCYQVQKLSRRPCWVLANAAQ